MTVLTRYLIDRMSRVIWAAVMLYVMVGGVGPAVTFEVDESASEIISIAILPMANHSAVAEAQALLAPLLEERLLLSGHRVIPTRDLRPILRQHRLRSIGSVGREGAGIIAVETGADYLVMGSWDVVRRGVNPEVGLTLRMLAVEGMCIVAAVNVGATGEDSAGMFGRGRVTTLEELARRTMDRAVEELLDHPLCPEVNLPSGGCFKIALVPLDNYSSTENAGDIVTNILLSRLMAAGYFVVEPGFVWELGLTREVISRGGVDFESARAILASLDACQIVTGEVEEFYSAGGDPTLTTPRVAVRLRATSPNDGNVLAMREIAAAGDDSDGFFQRGREHALIPLTIDLLEDFAHDLFKQDQMAIHEDD